MLQAELNPGFFSNARGWLYSFPSQAILLILCHQIVHLAKPFIRGYTYSIKRSIKAKLSMSTLATAGYGSLKSWTAKSIPIGFTTISPD
jgi:hypothetical protein